MSQQSDTSKRTETISIRIDSGLLNAFDHKIEEKGVNNRSKAIKELITEFVADSASEQKYNSRVMRWGVIWTAFDHHKSNVPQQLIDLQHQFQSARLENIGSLHFHVDKRHCLEVTIVKGEEGFIHRLIDETRSLQGTKHSGGSLIVPPDL
ncbi:MAG: ribbon-helix-helix protein, CopG family [Candidatus Thorarchaeota archaeon]